MRRVLTVTKTVKIVTITDYAQDSITIPQTPQYVEHRSLNSTVPFVPTVSITLLIDIMSTTSEEINILDYQKRPDHGEVRWTASMYKYCIGAPPDDPDFKKKGGAIVLIFIHHGFCYDDSSDWATQDFTTEFDHQDAQLVRILPMSLSASETTGYKAHINQTNFQMDLPMYRNRGHESFVFSAKFQESFVRVPLTWSIGCEAASGAFFGLQKEVKDKPLTAHAPVRALTVIKCYDPTKTLKVKFRHFTTSAAPGVQNSLTRDLEIKLSEF
ncbi:hypothetical protein ONZ45_g5196 [Pleurotus djamor]|nr:hypothetical protein ONZ45_g5196 [Pleurotus djamor]